MTIQGDSDSNLALDIALGGTNAKTAADAFTNIKQSATEAATGVVELATDAEAIAGSDTLRVITPANLKKRLSLAHAMPEWFGAVGDGVTDCTQAIQDAVDAAIAGTTYGNAVVFGNGTFLITSTITISEIEAFLFLGKGGTFFKWAGNATTPMFAIQNVGTSSFGRFSVLGNASAQLVEVFRSEQTTGYTVANHHNVFRDIYIEGINGYINYGIRGSIGSGGDNNNDFMSFDNVRVVNYAISGCSIEGTQANGWKFNNCYFVGVSGGTSKYAVSGGAAAGSASNFIWDGGFVGSNSEADFYVSAPSGSGLAYWIANVVSEGSSRFLITNSGSGSRTPIKLSGVRFSCDSLNADGKAMVIGVPGPIDIENCAFGEDYDHAPTIYWAPLTNYLAPYMSVRNTRFAGNWASASLAGVFTSRLPDFVSGVNAATADQSYALIDRMSSGSIYFPPISITTAEGVHDTGNDAATLVDSGETWPVNGYVGMTLYNITDGSSGTVTANTATSMTATLTGGTDNNWDVNDVWKVAPGPQQSGSTIYIGAATTILHPSTAGYLVTYYSTTAAAVKVDPVSDSMVITLNGTALSAGNELDSAGGAGDFITLHNVSATSAITSNRSGTWADGGAS